MMEKITRYCVGLFWLLSFCCCTLRAQRPRWVETESWSGNGALQTESFWIYGEKWRVGYRPRGRGSFHISAYDLNGEFLETVTDQAVNPLRGRRTLEGRGERHLGITGMGTSWNVTVQQYLSVIEEWQLLQLRKQPPGVLEKVGDWTGEDTDEEHPLAISGGSWLISFSNEGEGVLQVSLERDVGDEQVAESILAVHTEEPGVGSSWIHKSGTFRMRINAVDTKWALSVMSEPGMGTRPDPDAGEAVDSVDSGCEEESEADVSESEDCAGTTTDQADEDQSSGDDGGGE